MSFFRGIKRIYNETKEDDQLLRDAAGRPPIFNKRCRFKDFGGFANISNMHFYIPSGRSSLPDDFKICQDCFIASVAPTQFARSFMREMKSSKDPEELQLCALSSPLNEPAWQAAVQQGSEAPLVKRAIGLKALETNLLKCPGDGTATPSNIVPVGFRVLRHQFVDHPFRICEHHFDCMVQGLWIEDEFVKVQNLGIRTPCDFCGAKFSFGYFALQLSLRSFHPKVFKDWATNSTAWPFDILPCNGVIKGKNLVFQAITRLSRGTANMGFNHYFNEVQLPLGQQEACSINDNNRGAIAEALLKSTWKQDANIFLEVARDQSQVPPCPGTNKVRMKNWYGSEAVGVFMCCEECWRDIIVPSTLHQSFARYSDEANTDEYCCDMAIENVKPLFVAAAKTGKIETFKASMDNLVNQIKADNTAAQFAAQQAHQEIYNPELDLSRVSCSPSQRLQLQELAEEIKRLDSEAQNHQALYMMDMQLANTCQLGGRMVAGSRSIAAQAGAYKEYVRYSDGHNSWFDSEGEAKASRIRIESAWKQKEASRLRMLAAQKRDLLASMKRNLTPQAH